MTDKVQKIKEFLIGMAGAACCDTKTKKIIEINILPFIDSLQKELISEELEEASKKYALNNTPWDDCVNEIQESFKAGAKWQREQMQYRENLEAKEINLDFEKELYKAFGQVKDFTLGMHIAKHFYELGLHNTITKED